MVASLFWSRQGALEWCGTIRQSVFGFRGTDTTLLKDPNLVGGRSLVSLLSGTAGCL
jgi:hypothetical protein